MTLGVARLQKLLAIFNCTHDIPALGQKRRVLLTTAPGESILGPPQFANLPERASIGQRVIRDFQDVELCQEALDGAIWQP